MPPSVCKRIMTLFLLQWGRMAMHFLMPLQSFAQIGNLSWQQCGRTVQLFATLIRTYELIGKWPLLQFQAGIDITLVPQFWVLNISTSWEVWEIWARRSLKAKMCSRRERSQVHWVLMILMETGACALLHNTSPQYWSCTILEQQSQSRVACAEACFVASFWTWRHRLQIKSLLLLQTVQSYLLVARKLLNLDPSPKELVHASTRHSQELEACLAVIKVLKNME